MKFRRVADGYLLRLDDGEEVIATLTKFAADQNIQGGILTGMGAFASASIGIYNPPNNNYIAKSFREKLDVGYMTGNIAYGEETDEPFVHCHVTVSDGLFATYSGHLFEAVVMITLEIYLKTFKEKLIRKKDPQTGYNRWQL
jgi:predicted DNA-binding protein with PD1-like motif